MNAIVSDLLAVSDLGEKSVVFSMWDDMIDIVAEALSCNSIGFVRASSLHKIGETTRTFRSPDCSVLLLNVKNGAEGLNLIEATHVFMIEPLLNCGLDSQGKFVLVLLIILLVKFLLFVLIVDGITFSYCTLPSNWSDPPNICASLSN